MGLCPGFAGFSGARLFARSGLQRMFPYWRKAVAPAWRGVPVRSAGLPRFGVRQRPRDAIALRFT